ncbi:MAG: histidinol phosphate phosphatase domain-containing protein [Candidatus Magnetoovum sp. WYHC-5]|nr:histidinol phosphate phosphatase domain-containing protein [Candidatus Magnetoovum sp. WYHC-5]
MIDLHTHTIFSDGELIPSELVRRAEVCGYRAIALTDHVDSSNIESVVSKVVRAARDLNSHQRVRVIPGVEITHVPVDMYKYLVEEARRLGANIVVVHGETLVEPVLPGTNRAAIEAQVDILAHPGLISEEDLILAKEKGVTLEITARKGHSLTNGHVAKEALRIGVPLTLNTDSHSPSDLIDRQMAEKILLGAGIPLDKIKGIFLHAEWLVNKAISSR